MAKIMEGITSRTDKSKMLARLQEADERHELQKKIARVRRKWLATSPTKMHSVVLTASEQDWLDALEFLHDVVDVAPEALVRLYHGGRTMFAEDIEWVEAEDTKTDTEPEPKTKKS